MTGEQDISRAKARPPRQHGLVRRNWIRLRSKLKSQTWFTGLVVNLVYWFMRFVHWTSPFDRRSHGFDAVHDANAPVIFALWHGQHLMSPFWVTKGAKLVVMFSKSADAEVNARVVEKMGLETVRGSGGRSDRNDSSKGGARALLVLKKALDQGKSAVMIADISKGTARQAGLGVILLARLSGRPIISVAYATSRRHIIKKSWDQTAVNLPFGRSVVITGEPLYIGKDADDAEMEAYRAELTRRLNLATEEAYAIVDKRA